jgi:hypothetical protein
VHPAGSAPEVRWRPFDELLGELDARVAAVRAALAAASGRHPDAVELRVAASITQLGLTGRLVCPALGVAVLTGGLLDLDPARLRWRPGQGGAVALSVPDDAVAAASASGAPATGGPDAVAGGLAATVLAGPVRLLAEAGERDGLSPQVLWGNVASVVHGARALIGAAAPDLLDQAGVLVSGLLGRPPLRGTSRGHPGPAFRRRSCCLIYRLAEQHGVDTALDGVPAPRAVCGDCVLRPDGG